jgi:hypothetical protein
MNSKIKYHAGEHEIDGGDINKLASAIKRVLKVFELKGTLPKSKRLISK